MALKTATRKSDKGMWFQFSDGHFEKCEFDHAEFAWPDQMFINVGCGTESLKLRAEQLINEAGRYGRFNTLAYYETGGLEFLRFEKNDERGIDYIFKNVDTGEEVNSYGVNMREVNALHEVISDCWDAIQYERVCRGMNWQGGMYKDDVVSDEDLENAVWEAHEAYSNFGIFCDSQNGGNGYSPYVYAIGELFKHNPNFDAIVDCLKNNNIPLEAVNEAYKGIKNLGFSDSWYERFIETYERATKVRQERADNFLRRLATVEGCRVDEKSARILWEALVEYHGGNMDFPDHIHLCYDKTDNNRELFISRLYLEDGTLKCSAIREDHTLKFNMNFENQVNVRDFMEDLSVLRGVLDPLNVEKDSRGLYIDGTQKKAALDFVKKQGIIKTEKVKNIKPNNVKI